MNDKRQACWAVVPAAGIGSRMGSEVPKQYLQVAGATLLEHSLRALLACDDIVAVAVALNPRDERAGSLPLLQDPRILCVEGGAERSDSVMAGLDGLETRAATDDWVLVHDAARPCLPGADLQGLIEQVCSEGVGGILAQPITDTVKQAGAEGRVARTLDRSLLWRAQTPQMFRLDELREALLDASRQGLAVTDEASAMELAGYPVQLVPGSPSNLKVTLPADLKLAGWYLDQQAGRTTQ